MIKSAAGAATYVYDGQGRMLGEYDGSGGVLNETVWLGDLPVAVLTGSGGGAASYYVNPNHLGAPHVITDATGNKVWTWDPLAFGDNAPDQNPSSLGVFNYNLRFPGQYADAESGLNYNMARDYAPGLGRYVQSDPIGLIAGVNTYAYVEGNPVSRTDAFGLMEDNRKSSGGLGGLTNCVLEGKCYPARRGGPREDTECPPASSYSGSRRSQLQEPSGVPPRNSPTNINDIPYSGHAVDQMQNRGIPPSAVEQAIKQGEPLSRAGRNDRIYYYDSLNNITVPVDSTTGTVITVIPGKR
jgi:RHS repeat-associated protein